MFYFHLHWDENVAKSRHGDCGAEGRSWCVPGKDYVTHPALNLRTRRGPFFALCAQATNYSLGLAPLDETIPANPMPLNMPMPGGGNRGDY